MDEGMGYITGEYTEDPPEAFAEWPQEPYADDAQGYLPSDQEIPAEDITGRIDDLLEQISVENTYGSMGDYYAAEAGCYAFPGEDVFFYFVGDAERPGWTAASNGCYVPAASLEAYENYLISLHPEETEGAGDAEGLPPPVTQEDLAGLAGTLEGSGRQDAVFYETAEAYMKDTDAVLVQANDKLTAITIVLVVLCVFTAISCGARFADTFFTRMRAG